MLFYVSCETKLFPRLHGANYGAVYFGCLFQRKALLIK